MIRRLIVVAMLAASAASCGTEPRDPFVGEFDLTIHFTSESFLVTCPVGGGYCYDTGPLDETLQGSISIPIGGDAGHAGIYRPVSISFGTASFPSGEVNTTTTTSPWEAIASNSSYGIPSPPLVDLRGAFQGDSIAGTVSWHYSSSVHGNSKYGTFVARRK